MKKKIIIPLIFVSIIFLVGSFFGYAHWWAQNLRAGGVDDFVIKKTPEGKIVENEREKITFKVPEGWKVVKGEDKYLGTWGVGLLSPDLEHVDFISHLPEGQRPSIYKKGCHFGIAFETTESIVDRIRLSIEDHKKIGFLLKKPLEYTEKEIKDEEGNIIGNRTTIFEINNHLGIKEIITNDPQVGLMFDLKFPVNKFKNIYFSFMSPLNEQDRCFDEFKKILEDVFLTII